MLFFGFKMRVGATANLSDRPGKKPGNSLRGYRGTNGISILWAPLKICFRGYSRLDKVQLARFSVVTFR